MLPRVAPILIAALAAALLPTGGAAVTDRAPAGVITVQGETPARSNIPVAADPRASGGKYLSLDTVHAPPDGGWYATYRLAVPAAGVYRLDAVLTSPAMADRDPKGGSWFDLSVNGAPYGEVAKSEPAWADPRQTPPAWGSLVHARIGDVELGRGINTISFRVVEPRVSMSPVGYHFLLDVFTLTPVRVALASVYLSDPASNLGIYRDDRELLHFRLNGHAPRSQTVAYRILDYFSRTVAAGAARVPAGAGGAAIRLPHLPPGNYRAIAALRSAPTAQVTGYFARLPARLPVMGPANRFGVTTSAPWLLPPSRVAPFARALRAAGVGYVRDEMDWKVIEPARGRFLTSPAGRFAHAFRAAGIRTLGALWTLTGNLRAPGWATTPASGALPADLRDAYALMSHLARQAPALGLDALEVWNEPDVDVSAGTYSRTPADQHAAYVKAATLAITDHASRPLASLSGLAGTGPFQDVMLQNGVARYADLWAFHAYGYAFTANGTPVQFPPDAATNAELRRLYEYQGQLWMTESGIFLKAAPDGGLNYAQQVTEARYLVQSTVLDFAAGVGKLFWFSGPPYCAAGFACFGLFDSYFRPWPAYSALAAMTSLLGRANFAHELHGLPAGVSGDVFKDGGRAVTVVWARSPAKVDVPVPGDGVRMYDIMGASHPVLATARGAVRLVASPDPVYLVSGGGAGLAARPAARDDRRTIPRLPAADHIVLNQRYAAAAMPAPPPFGYRLRRTTAMSLDVYNFNATPQTVTVVPHAWGGWVAAPAAQTVSVPANGRVSVPFVLTARATVHPWADYPLVFAASMAGRPGVTPSVSRILLDSGTP
ncbi:MAG: hypothetical protein JO242_11495, partial [Streptosporangiaceae bacterium]|nr:hypothetical protein [Streptosporangiaceae bacterium]